MYRGLNSIEKFFTDIFEEEKEILEKLKEFQNTPMRLSNKKKDIINWPQVVTFVNVVSLLRIVRFVTIAMF